MSTRDENIIGGQQLDELLQTLPGKMQRNINRSALRAGAAALLPEVVQRIPVASGDLRASARITTRARGATVSASVKVGNQVAWYAHLVEYGTRPHVIKPREAKGAMQFGGVTTKSVQHPGTRPQPFMRPAIDISLPQVVEAFTRKMRERLTKQGLDTPEALPGDPDQ
jgi:HK97 gp10 family phage protein